MNQEKVIAELAKQDWWVEECPGALQFFLVFMRGFCDMRKAYDFPFHSMVFAIFNNGMGEEWTPEKEKEQIFDFWLDKYKHDKGYLHARMDRWQAIVNGIVKRCNTIRKAKLREVKDDELEKLYTEFFDSNVEQVSYSAAFEGIDPFSQKYLIPLLQRKYKLDMDNAREYAVILSASTTMGFMNTWKVEFLRLCILAKQGKLTEKAVQQHQAAYAWIRSNYENPKLWAAVAEEIEHEVAKSSLIELQEELYALEHYGEKLKKEKQATIKKLALENEDKLLFELIVWLAELIDRRKWCMLQHVYCHQQLLEEIGRRAKVAVEDIKYLLDTELRALLRGTYHLDKAMVSARRKCSVFVKSQNSEQLFVGKDAEEIIAAARLKQKHDTIQGLVACHRGGDITGEVTVVMNPQKDSFAEGTILVTTMTRPDFLSIMHKAAAIITDEGGITCHAAIVARELGIPCIVGCKVATKILKNGDSVLLDVSRGIVRKL